MARPEFDYDPKIADAMCELLAMGWSLRKVIDSGEDEYEDMKFPSISTVFKWMRENNEFSKQYARAKQESADAMAEELIDIADGASDVVTGIDRSDSARVQAEKLKIDTRKFLMAKMKPKKYGDKLDLTSDGERIKMEPIYVSTIKARNADPEAKPKKSS